MHAVALPHLPSAFFEPVGSPFLSALLCRERHSLPEYCLPLPIRDFTKMHKICSARPFVVARKKNFEYQTALLGEESVRQLTVFAVVHDLPVEAVKVLGVPGEGGGVARHGVPRPHRQQPALLVLRHQVLQHRPVVDERVQLPAGEIASSRQLAQARSLHFEQEMSKNSHYFLVLSPCYNFRSYGPFTELIR